MLTQARLGDSLMKNLMAKREEKGEISLEDVGNIFQEVAADFQSLGGEKEALLQTEIMKMADYIEKAKSEIMSLSDDENSETKSNIADATMQLDAVVKATEKATNEIMDATDAIQAAASEAGGEVEQKITDASMRIFEACNFQDLTGQQINRVVKVINFLDERLHSLTNIFSDTANATSDASEASAPAPSAESYNEEDMDLESLKNGPQLEQPSQEDIDALFDSFDTDTSPDA